MAVYNRERSFIYTFEPHTASRATKEYLLKIRNSTAMGNHHANVFDLFNSRRAVLRPCDKLGITVVSTVRNPLDWLLTRFWASHQHRQDPKMFRPWLQQWIDHKDKPLFGEHAGYANRVIYYETLKDDLDDFLMDKGLAECDLPLMEVIGRTEGKPDWREFYTTDLIKMVQDGFPEMQAYGYNVWYFAGGMNVTISRGNKVPYFR